MKTFIKDLKENEIKNFRFTRYDAYLFQRDKQYLWTFRTQNDFPIHLLMPIFFTKEEYMKLERERICKEILFIWRKLYHENTMLCISAQKTPGTREVAQEIFDDFCKTFIKYAEQFYGYHCFRSNYDETEGTIGKFFIDAGQNICCDIAADSEYESSDFSLHHSSIYLETKNFYTLSRSLDIQLSCYPQNTEDAVITVYMSDWSTVLPFFREVMEIAAKFRNTLKLTIDIAGWTPDNKISERTKQEIYDLGFVDGKKENEFIFEVYGI